MRTVTRGDTLYCTCHGYVVILMAIFFKGLLDQVPRRDLWPQLLDVAAQEVSETHQAAEVHHNCDISLYNFANTHSMK